MWSDRLARKLLLRLIPARALFYVHLQCYLLGKFPLFYFRPHTSKNKLLSPVFCSYYLVLLTYSPLLLH